MDTISVTQLLPVVQVAVGPAILISGDALLLLVLTNRLGRVVDRSRELNRELRKIEKDDHHISKQIDIVFTRARWLRAAIALAGSSALLAASLVITLFVTAVWHLEIGFFVMGLFLGCLLALIAGLTTFMFDVQLSLKALRVELDR